MKKSIFVVLFLSVCFLMTTGCTTGGGNYWSEAKKMNWQTSIAKSMDEGIKPVDESLDLRQGLVVEVKPYKEGFALILDGVRLVPKDDVKSSSAPASMIQLSSGTREVIHGKDSRMWKAAPVKNGKVGFFVPNIAKTEGCPVVQKHDGHGKTADGIPGFLMLDPDDPFVIYPTTFTGKPDLQKLCIAYVMYPDGTVRPLKEVLAERGEKYTNEYIAGRHPELGTKTEPVKDPEVKSDDEILY